MRSCVDAWGMAYLEAVSMASGRESGEWMAGRVLPAARLTSSRVCRTCGSSCRGSPKLLRRCLGRWDSGLRASGLVRTLVCCVLVYWYTGGDTHRHGDVV